ncbi:MAG: ABC transporter permease [Terriglobia bacterium]|jgi:predicted permease
MLSDPLYRLRALFRRKSMEAELDEELHAHVAYQVEKYIQSGLTREEAARRARLEFRGLEQVKEECCDARGVSFVETLIQDVRYGLRMLARNRLFTIVAILTLALGIGANTAIFSVMDVMLLRALPVKNPQELVEFIRLAPDGSMMTNLPYAVFQHLRENTTVLSGIFAFMADTRVLRAGVGSEHSRVHEVSGGFFSTLGVNPLLGRTIDPNDDRPDTEHQVVLSYPFWSRRFGRDPSVVGATVRVSGIPCTVIGVMPPDFFGVDRSQLPDMWAPLALDRDPGDVWVLGRLKPGVSIAQARAQLEPLFKQALESLRDGMKDWPEHERDDFLAQKLLVNRATTGTSGLRWQYWEYSNTLKILIGMTGLVLLISCVNLANLLMARSAGRLHEIGIRLAIGAGPRRIFRQLLTENLVLALLGGVVGLLIAAGGHRLLVAFLAGDLQRVSLNFRLDGHVLAFSLAMSLLTGLLSGVLPALRAAREDLLPAVHGASHLRGATRLPFARKLLTTQVALSLMLLVGAGLFVRSLRNLATTDLGLARENLVLMRVDPSLSSSVRDRREFWMQLTERLATLPGVRSVSLAGDAVFGNGGWNETIWTRQPDGAEHDATVPFNVAGPGFFETVQIPLLTGREFGWQDRGNSPPVAVVNRAFARKFFDDQNPLGKRFGNAGPGSSSQIEIVGIIGDAKYGDLREQPQPMFYLPLFQHLEERPYQVHARTAGDSATAIAAIRREIQAMDQDISIDNLRTINQVIHGLLQHDRMFAFLASVFGLLALLLTSIGIYGVVAYQVTRRTGEIGIRMALGAQRTDVLWMVMRETLLVLAAGAAIGLPAAVAAARVLRSLLFALGPSDPATIIWATATLVGAGALAGFLPARRAASISPMDALRHE